jgi:hypothetical protein
VSESPLQRLHREIDRTTTDPYLVTVTGDRRPHCACSLVVWDEGRLLVPAPSGWPTSEAIGCCDVTLLWPPAQSGGYSLIVDGTASTAGTAGQAMLALTPTRAVWHRRGQPADPSGTACGSDCISIFPD